MTDSHGMTITLRDVYEDVRAQKELLQHMSAKIDKIATTHDVHSSKLDDHESRIRDLEKLVWRASGIAAFIGAAAGTVVNLLVK